MISRSSLALAVLALLFEAPLHPYRMQQLIRERGKDRVIYLGQRTSLYKTIDRLRRDELIAVRETVRQTRRPERTVYEITDTGRVTVLTWMREMLSTPRAEFPEFPAAIAYLSLLHTDDALRQLETRRSRLEETLADIEVGLAAVPEGLPRLFLLEEYLRTITSAELAWVGSLVEDLRAGRLTWTAQWLAKVAPELDRTPDEEPHE